MATELQLGGRILIIDVDDSHSDSICQFFADTLVMFEDVLEDIMNECEIPEQITLTFKEGNETLDGIYHVQPTEVAQHVIAIDIYTRQFIVYEDKGKQELLQKELLETFVHELIHHKHKDERVTARKAKEFMRQIAYRFKKE